MPELFELALEQVREHRPDLLAVTGDLLDVPNWLESPVPGFTHDDAEPWFDAAVKDYQLVKALLDGSGVRYTVLPGNHDLAPAMWQVFDSQANIFDIAGHRVVRFCDHEHDGHMPRRFIPQRTLFSQQLSATDPTPQIHLQHYVVSPHIASDYPMNYEEHAWLTQQITQSQRVRLCLSGHYHVGTSLHEMDNTTFAVTPGFCDYPHRWRLYDVNDAGVRYEQFSMTDEATAKRRVVFLDRDGVINDLPHYCAGPEAMRLLPGVASAIRQLNDAGRAVVVVTNQNGVGHGNVPHEVVDATNDRMHRLLAEEAGAEIDAVYAAIEAGPAAVLPKYAELTHQKPKPTMLLEAREQLHLDFTDAWLVGDNITDARAAAAAGVRPILVRTGHGTKMATKFKSEFANEPIVDDLVAAVPIILDRPRRG